MEVSLSKLSIGFNADVKVVERNEFEITGDVSVDVEYVYGDILSSPRAKRVNKLTVIYNHDGLLEHVYNGQEVPDNILLFKDVETYVNSSWGGRINIETDGDEYETTDIRLTDNNSIEVYADITLDSNAY